MVYHDDALIFIITWYEDIHNISLVLKYFMQLIWEHPKIIKEEHALGNNEKGMHGWKITIIIEWIHAHIV